MSAIDGLIILDSTGKAIVSSHFRAHAVSYPLLHIDAFNAALQRSKARAATTNRQAGLATTRGRKNGSRGGSSGSGAGSSSTIVPELDPVLTVNVPAASSDHDASGGGMLTDEGSNWVTAALCHVERESMHFLVPISQEVNPLLAFAFLDSFFETLTSYLGDITESSIRDNFDTVYMLVEEMLDEGHPMTMETNMLKEIILPPTLMRKLLSVAGVSGAIAQNTLPFMAPIPWRKPNPRYTTNEIYFDIEESIDAILDRKGKVLSSEVWGRISCNAKLSGNPDLLLTFSSPKLAENCSFHPCVRYKRWMKDRVLSFIPPDGNFKLMDYQVAKPQGAIARPIALPLILKPLLQLTPEASGGGKFQLTLSSRCQGRPVENIVVSIYLGEAATGVSATATGDSRSVVAQGANGGAAGAIGGVGGGTWEFDPNTGKLTWSLSSLTSNERPPSLTGTFTASNASSVPSPAFDVSFEIGQYSLSGLKVEQLRVLGDAQYKPFKGIRTYVRSGKMEVRW